MPLFRRPARRTSPARIGDRTLPAPAAARRALPDRAASRQADPPVRRDAAAAVPFELQVTAGYAWRFIVIAVAAWGLLQILGATTTVVIPLAVALLLTGLLMPVAVLFNHRLGWPRHAAAAVTVIAFLALVVGLLSLAGTKLVSGVADLVQQANLGVDRLTQWLQDGPLHYPI